LPRPWRTAKGTPWEQLAPWLTLRSTLPVGALFCVLRGPTGGRPWAAAGVRVQLHDAARRAGVRRRFAPHQLRHAHAVEMSREGVPLLVSSASSGTPISRSPRSICAASTTPRSCTPSTNDPRPQVPPITDFRCTDPALGWAERLTHPSVAKRSSAGVGLGDQKQKSAELARAAGALRKRAGGDPG
jgi:hypothetical protein